MVSLLLQNPAVLPRLHGSIKPEYFNDYHLGVIVRETLTYYAEHAQVPAPHHIRDRLVNLAGIEKARGVVDCLEELCCIQITNQSDLENKIWRFGQRQSVLQALHEILGMAKEDQDLTDSANLLQRALDQSGTTFDPGLDYKATLPNLQADLRQSALYNPRMKIPFGDIKELNAMTRGGIGEKELYVVGAPPKRGKTSFLTYVGATAAMRGHNVLHVSLESKILDCRVNYTSMFTGWTRDQVAAANDPGMTQKLAVACQHVIGDLRIAYFPPETLSIENLKSWIMQLRTACSFIPKLLIIDYPDRMKLDNPNDVYNSMGRLYDRIITMLDEFNMHGLAASQLGRAAGTQEAAGAELITDSWKKIANLDGLIIINQTGGERDRGTARLDLNRTRRGVGGIVRVRVDHSRCEWRSYKQGDVA